MRPTNKLLGIIAMAAAPFLFLQFLLASADGGKEPQSDSLGGLFDLIYMIGWMCSVVGLLQLRTPGTKRAMVGLFYLQLSFLCIANIWNIWVIVDPGNQSTLFFILDLFWPLSNVCMLVVGIVIAVTGYLKGWRRYIVLLVGCWLPIALGSMMLFGRNDKSLWIGGLYSTLAWALLGWMIFRSEPAKPKLFRPAY